MDGLQLIEATRKVLEEMRTIERTEPSPDKARLLFLPKYQSFEPLFRGVNIASLPFGSGSDEITDKKLLRLHKAELFSLLGQVENLVYLPIPAAASPATSPAASSGSSSADGSSSESNRDAVTISQYGPNAHAHLKRAILLNKELLDAHNALGEICRKDHNLKFAAVCYQTVVRLVGNLPPTDLLPPQKLALTEAYRGLSSLARATNTSPHENVTCYEHSIDLAKSAIRLDFTEGKSWNVLGTAYLYNFFQTHDPSDCRKARKAFLKAADCATPDFAALLPEIWHNRAVLEEFEAEWEVAGGDEGFAGAVGLDETFAEAEEGLRRIRTIKKRLVGKLRGSIEEERGEMMHISLAGFDSDITVLKVVQQVSEENRQPQVFLTAGNKSGSLADWENRPDGILVVYFLKQGTIRRSDTISIPIEANVESGDIALTSEIGGEMVSLRVPRIKVRESVLKILLNGRAVEQRSTVGLTMSSTYHE